MKYLIFSLFALLGLVACLPNNKTKYTQLSQDYSTVQTILTDNRRMADDASTTGSINKTLAGTGTLACATVTVNTGGKTALIDFGTTGSTCIDQKKRTGKIMVSWTKDDYRAVGNVVTIHYDNYTVDGIKVDNNSSTVYTVVGTAGSGGPRVQVVDNYTFTTLENKTMKWTADRKQEWTEGWSTPAYPLDDVWTLTDGNGSLTGSNGEQVTVGITKPVVWKFFCSNMFYVSTTGTLKFVLIGSPTAGFDIDFGSGTCDYSFTIKTTDGKTYEVNIR